MVAGPDCFLVRQLSQYESDCKRLGGDSQMHPPAVCCSSLAGAKAVGQATHECCTSAALLGVGALGLLFADARLFHLARCLVASVALSSGYAQTARRAATGNRHHMYWVLC